MELEIGARGFDFAEIDVFLEGWEGDSGWMILAFRRD